MSACDPYTWNGSKACPYPNYGYTPPTTNPDASPSHYIHISFFHHIFGTSGTSEVINSLLILLGLYLAAFLIYKALQYVRPVIGLILRHRGVGKLTTENIFLELTFPADTSKSAFATEEFNILMRKSAPYRNRKEKLAANKQLQSEEIYATHDGGIRYVMVVPEHEVNYVEHSLRSYLPGLKIKQVSDYLPAITASKSVGIIELRLSNDYVLPLKDHKALEEHDPMAYVTGHMTKLLGQELMAYQIVYTPVYNRTHTRVNRHINELQNRIALGKEVSTQLKPQRTLKGYGFYVLWHTPLWLLHVVFKVLTGAVQVVFSAFSQDHASPDFLKSDTGKKLLDNPYERELGEAIKSKLDQPLFEVAIRILVAADDPDEIDRRLRAITASLQPFRTSRQGLIEHSGMSIFDKRIVQFELFKERRLSPHFPDQQTIISASELADLYHFPETSLTKTEGLVKSRSQELPAPLSIKNSDTKLDVIVGVNNHGGESQPIGLTLEQRQMHTYVIGKTGTGKTTLLTSSIYQDMVNGKGLAVLDPHGDMFKELLKIIPEHRKQDVIIFDPNDEDHPIGLNILDPGIEFSSENRRQKWITDHVLSIFEKLADERLWGPRMEHVLRSTTLTALQVPNCSLYTIQRLLTDKSYQRKIAKTLTDPVLKQFWQREFALMGGMQLSNVTQPLTNRLGNFITIPMSRHILMQEKSTISIADIMNEGKILLVNIAKGQVGEDESAFFGTIITSLIWLAASQRISMPEAERRDFFLYVDEFQNFATERFAEIFSEGRKFRIGLIISHQNIAQIKDKAGLQVMAENAHTLISLKAGPNDEAFILPFMRPEVERGDIVNLAPYHFYMKTTGDEAEAAFSGTTVPLDVQGSDETAEAIVAYSQEHYATQLKEVKAYMEKLFGPDDKPKPKGKPKGKKGPPNNLHGA
jgi:hypothetical protein